MTFHSPFIPGSYSSVGVWVKDRVEVVANSAGNRSMPSCVAYTDIGETVVGKWNFNHQGEGAKSQESRNPRNTITDVKRCLGRAPGDPEIQELGRLYRYKVVPDGKTVKISVENEEGPRLLAPEEVGAAILAKLKETAEV